VDGVKSLGNAGAKDLSEREYATHVQERLRALGYMQETGDGIWGSKSRAALRDFRRVAGLGGDDRWDARTESALMSADAPRAGSRPMGAAIQAESTYPPPTDAKYNPLNRADALWVQDRLREKGFYSGNRDGIWGLSSRSALQAFKINNGLPGD